MTALPPVPEVTVMVPLPFAGEEVTEYVALNAAPETAPLGAPISSVAVRVPVGVAPSAVNSPEKTVTPNAAGLLAKPAYVPFSAPLVNEPAAWGSPNPNETLESETKRKT
jgi:hypothetical protein